MEIADLIRPQRVIPTLRASDKPRLLREISERAASPTGLDGRLIPRAIQSREALGSTGVGHWIALPHARIAGLVRFFGLFSRLERPIAFEAIDDRPVDFVFLLLIPEDADDEHLAALACVSLHLRRRDVADRLRAAQATAELYDLLTLTAQPHNAPIGTFRAFWGMLAARPQKKRACMNGRKPCARRSGCARPHWGWSGRLRHLRGLTTPRNTAAR